MTQPILHLGSEGLGVGQLHQALIEAGVDVAHDELVSEAFGPTTLAAIRIVQSEHGLVVDGVVGPRTWRALKTSPRVGFVAPLFRPELEVARPVVRPVLERALAEIGTQETGDNEGPILKYGGNPGEPYCIYFVSWCYALGGYPFGKLASAYKLLMWGEEHGRILPADAPIEPGDIGVRMRTRFRGHGFLFVSRERDGLASTVGGNESGAVRGNVRRRSFCTAIIRPIP